MKWDAGLYDSSHRFVSDYGRDLTSLLEPVEGGKLLDLGCGTGDLAGQLAEMGWQVTGIDSSLEMIEKAEKKFPDIPFYEGKAQDFSLKEKFDAVFTNATLHWISSIEQPVVLKNVRNHLKKGGQLVGEMGGFGNVASIREVMRKILSEKDFPKRADAEERIWFFPTAQQYGELLEGAGFKIELIRLFDRPTLLSGGADGLRNWLLMFGSHWLDGLDKPMKDDIIEAATSRIKGIIFDNGSWIADYKRLRFRAIAI